MSSRRSWSMRSAPVGVGRRSRCCRSLSRPPRAPTSSSAGRCGSRRDARGASRTTKMDRVIERPANPRVKAAARLRERRERDATGLTLVDGGREALRAMEAGAVVESAFVCPPLLATREAKRVAEKLSQSFGPFGAAVEYAELGERAFERLAYGDRADGVILVVR